MKSNKVTCLVLLLIVLIGNTSVCQDYNIYNPYITHFSKKSYSGGIENWDAGTTLDGYIYFANNEGMLEYNGYNWKIYKLPNKTIVRSIAIDHLTKRIYVGGQDEVGYFYPDDKGVLIYKSLKNLLPEKNKFLEDVWEIQMAGKNVIFRSLNTIFLFDQQKISTLNVASKTLNFIKYVDGLIYYGDPEKGLFEVFKNQNKFVPGSEIFKGQKIRTFVKLRNGKHLIVTERNGIFNFNGKTFTPFTSSVAINDKILSSGVAIDKNLIAIGSVLQGIMFFDTLGVMKNNITKKKGLQTNAIISLLKDNNGNLWAGTTNGIDQILINSPYSLVYPDDNLEGGAYAVKIYKNKLYIGTNNGLYYTDWESDKTTNKSTDFKKIYNSDGQVWALDIIGDDLFMGHNEGAFQIKNNTAIKISKDYIGTWRFISLPDKNVMITGTYEGFQLFRKQGQEWIFIQRINGFNESARIIAKDIEDNIWVSHPYRGVYKLTLNSDYTSVKQIKNYGKADGLPSDLANYVIRLKNDIYVNAETGVYRYVQNSDLFTDEKQLTDLMGNNINVRRLFQDSEETIWYVNETDCGVILVNDSLVSKNVIKKSTPFINGKLIGGFENIYAPNKSSVFVCTDKGVIIVDFKRLQKKQDLKIHFTELQYGTTNKNLIYGGHGTLTDEEVNIDYNQNSIKFGFSSNQLDITNQVKYSYFLKGYDKEWSTFSDINYYEINNLKPGKYKFTVKAIASYGAESNEISYEFRIKSPWYSSLFALILYALLFIFGLLLYRRLLNNKHETEKIQLKQEKEVSEAKVEILENEKLQTEIEFKNRELALSTMHILQKNETLTKLREELDQAIKQSKEPETRSSIKKVISILSDDQRLEDDWDSFAVHFDQVHTDFLKRLKIQYPQLSPKDLKLCAYLRMNLTTKDIAPLLNISVRGVEISRYRLRKKMNIDADTNLNDYMMGY